MVSHRLHHHIDHRPHRLGELPGIRAVSMKGAIHGNDRCMGPDKRLAGDFDVSSVATVVGAMRHDHDPLDLTGKIRIHEHTVASRSFDGPRLDTVVFAGDLIDLLRRRPRLIREIRVQRSRIRTSSRRTDPPSDAVFESHSSWIVAGCPISSPWWIVKEPCCSPSKERTAA